MGRSARKRFIRWCGRWSAILPVAVVTVWPCHAASAEDAGHDHEIEEIVVTADLGSMPGSDVRSIFGFDKSILETPRSASTISEEMMSRFIISDIDELIALAPGSFTQSFFGVAGTLDIRGTPGETYFRGVRRLDNPGNYPTPIAASSRIDIVRGPASPIHGPAKIGGYINFDPQSAHIDAGNGAVSGSVSLEAGSWERRVGTAEISGPGRLGEREFGYHLYAEIEDFGQLLPKHHHRADHTAGLLRHACQPGGVPVRRHVPTTTRAPKTPAGIASPRS